MTKNASNGATVLGVDEIGERHSTLPVQCELPGAAAYVPYVTVPLKRLWNVEWLCRAA